MRILSDHINEYRIRQGALKSNDECGLVGCFMIPLTSTKLKAMVIASDGEGWEHVSVSTGERCLTWDEMCFIKDLFWNKDETVVQFHPPEGEYVKNHPYCLHLWRPLRYKIELPASILVGVK